MFKGHKYTMKVFLRTSRAFSVRWDLSKFRSSNPGLRHSTRMKWKSVLSPYNHLTVVSMTTFCAQLLVFDKTFTQPDVCAVVNCSVVGLSVLTSMFQRAASQFAVMTALRWPVYECVVGHPLFQRADCYFSSSVWTVPSVHCFMTLLTKRSNTKKPLRNKQTNCQWTLDQIQWDNSWSVYRMCGTLSYRIGEGSVAYAEHFRRGESIGVAKGAKGAMRPKFLEKIVILCFERRFSEQISVIRL